MTQREQQLISDVHRLQVEIAQLKLGDTSGHGSLSPTALELRASKSENFELKLANESLVSKLRRAESLSGRLKGTISTLESDCENLRSKLKAEKSRPTKVVEKERVVYAQSPETLAVISELQAEVSLLKRELAAGGSN